MEDNFKIVDGKMVTAAVVMIDPDGNILGCHAYGRKENEGYDFPKGCVDEGEDDLQAAIRELREETDIHLLDYDRARIIDAGVFPHNKEKRIHIFIYKTDYFPDLSQLKCTSYFEFKGKEYPEVDGYKIISKDERYMFNKVLQDKFIIIDKYNKM